MTALRAVSPTELRELRRLRKLLRQVMEAGHLLLMADHETNQELIKLARARNVH